MAPFKSWAPVLLTAALTGFSLAHAETNEASAVSTATVTAPAAVPETAATAAAEVPAPDPDGGWPRLLTAESGAKIQMYQPQVEAWTDQKNLVAWTAVEYLKRGSEKSDLGTAKWEAKTSVALQERLVKFENIQMKQVNFPSLDQGRAREVTKVLTGVFPKEGLVIALDRILAAMDKSVLNTKGTEINRDPPPIFYASRPAQLVQLDGEPILSPIKDSPLKFIVNTNWDIIQDPDLNLYYMRLEKHWLSSKALETGWVPVKNLPKSFGTIPNDDNWKDVRESIPAESIRKNEVPLLYFSKKPAELILTDGKPKTERVGKSNLLWIKNTECDVFQMKKGRYYFLVAGRWFSADKLEGPWKFATADLPQEFAAIPRTHPRARVRAAIPGTDEATEAVLLAQIPQTLRISRKGLQIPEVKYQGEPQFKEIKGTKVSYAGNTANDVLKVGDMYYLCYQAAWFQSRSPNGPWDLTTKVPEEIYQIPADCPVYHVTYVRVDSYDKETVTYSCNSGYSGVTVSFGVAMWGTGWYYPPYSYYGGYYPVYYPYHHSYGGNPIYNPRTGAYGFGSSVSGPNGGLARAATYNPNTGTYARGSAAWGPNGSQANISAYNPRTGTSFQSQQNRNSQGQSWGSSKVQRGDDWAQTGHVKGDKGSISGGRTSEGDGFVRGKGEDGSGFVGKKGDDIYAGKDGNVYRKTEDGWQQHSDGGWTDVDKGDRPSAGTHDRPSAGTLDRESAGTRDRASAGTRDQLNRDAGSRREGNNRVESRGSSNRGGGSYSGNRGSMGSGSRGGGYSGGGSRGSYGGGARGGGGGRRR